MQEQSWKLEWAKNKAEELMGWAKKGGLVTANLAVRSPVPRSALFLK
jgi:hypothetical protein